MRVCMCMCAFVFVLKEAVQLSYNQSFLLYTSIKLPVPPIALEIACPSCPDSSSSSYQRVRTSQRQRRHKQRRRHHIKDVALVVIVV